MNNTESRHSIKGIDPVADAFAGTVTTDVVNVKGEGALFTLYKGVGATGTSTITVLACDDTTPSNTTAVTFMYRACTSGDTWGSWTQATTAGFTTTAGSSQLYQVYVDASQLAEEGYGYAQLQAVEVVDSPVVGAILIEIVEPRVQPVAESLID